MIGRKVRMEARDVLSGAVTLAAWEGVVRDERHLRDMARRLRQHCGEAIHVHVTTRRGPISRRRRWTIA